MSMAIASVVGGSERSSVMSGALQRPAVESTTTASVQISMHLETFPPFVLSFRLSHVHRYRHIEQKLTLYLSDQG